MTQKIFRNKKNIIITVAALILLGALTAGYFVFASKPARQFYLEAEGKNFKKYSSEIKEIYKTFYENQKPYMEGKYKNRIEVTGDVQSESDKPFGIENAANIFEFVRKSKLIIDNQNSPDSKESLTKLALVLEKTPLIDSIVYTKDRQLGFSVPVLLPEKYFTINLDRINDVYSRFNIPLRPVRVARDVDIAKAISFSDERLDNTAKDYGSLISSFLKEVDVKYGKQVVVNVGTEQRKGKEVLVKLGSEATKNMISKLCEKLSADDTFLKLTYENYADVIKIFDEAGYFQVVQVLDDMGYFGLNDIEKRYLDNVNVKKDLEGFKKAIKVFPEEAEFQDGLQMALVIDSSGNILDRKLNLSCTRKEKGKHILEVHTGSNDIKSDNLKNGFCSFTLGNIAQNGERLDLVWDINTKITPLEKDGDEKGNISISHTRKKDNVQELWIQAKLGVDGFTDAVTLKKNSLVKYDIEYKVGNNAWADKYDGELNTISWKNNKQKTRNSNSKLLINTELPSFGIKKTTLKFDLKREDRFGVDFNLPEVQADNKIDLNNITDKEIAKAEDDILASFGTFYLKNKPIIDAVTGGK